MSNSAADNSFIAEVLPAFISEANEQIETLEQLLLELEDAPDDRELLDALFRCAHTIKGSAGMFGLDAVVAFTHHVETLLDRLRDGKIALTPALGSLLLQSNDQIRLLIGAAQDPLTETVEAEQTRAAIVLRLQIASGETGSPDAGSTLEAAVAAVDAAPGAAGGEWQVSVVFDAATFRNGMDPLAILNYVRGLGTMTHIRCNSGAVPALDALDADDCHLGFDFGLVTDVGHDGIENAFSFVREDCTLTIVAPPPVAASAPDANLAAVAAATAAGNVAAISSELAARIGTLPAGQKLGEMLVAVGAVTPDQLHRGLLKQTATTSADAKPLLGQILVDETGVDPRVVAAALRKQQQREGDENRFIRVQADRLDEVITLLGELVIAGAGASQLARDSRLRPLIEANRQITRLIEEVRNSTLQLRMVPIGETFARFRRVVRDTAAELEKDVALEIVGGETELDKAVVERIADPLMHLVRNALDHGLETPEQRLASGKPAQGTLTLSACHESGSVLIRILDNGRGIARDKVLQRAWERGLVKPGTVPPDNDILKLIFEPGFSTAEKITNHSGRGVGMDVVRRNIEALRGSVAISSEAGSGSCIEIRLPLTLAIIEGFLIGIGPSKFVVPLDAVCEVIATRPESTPFDASGRSCIEVRGELLPVVSLRTLYALNSPQPERGSVLVIRAGDTRYGVIVDALLGQQQTVIKPLGRLLQSMRGVSGSSILGSGEVALILDVNSLGVLAAAESFPAMARGSLPPAVHLPDAAGAQHLQRDLT